MFSLQPRPVYRRSCSVCTHPIPVAAVNRQTAYVESGTQEPQLQRTTTKPVFPILAAFRTPLAVLQEAPSLIHPALPCRGKTRPRSDVDLAMGVAVEQQKPHNVMGEGKNLKVHKNALIRTDRIPFISALKVYKGSNSM